MKKQKPEQTKTETAVIPAQIEIPLQKETITTELLMTKLYNKSDKARSTAISCYRNGEYTNCLNEWIETGYFKALATTVDGEQKDINESVDLLKIYLTIDDDGSSLGFRTLKKLNKLDKKEHIQEALNQFIISVSDDFLALSKKMNDVCQTIAKMGLHERIAKGLGIGNENPEDKLFKEDVTAMAIFKKRKSTNVLAPLKLEVQKILQEK